MSERLYAIASKIDAGKLDTEIGYSAIFAVLIPMCIAYVIAASTALSKLDKCEFDETKKKYLTHSIVVAITIPAAFLISKLVRKDVAMWMILYGSMALVGSAFSMEAVEACGGDDTQKTYNSFYIMGFGVTVLLGIFGFLFV